MIPISRLLATAVLLTHACLGATEPQTSATAKTEPKPAKSAERKATTPAQEQALEKARAQVIERVVLFEVLVAEMSAQERDWPTAFAHMLDAAQRAKSDKLFERTVELAFAGRNASDALRAAQSWAQVLPTSVAAHRYTAQILIGLNRLSEVPEHLQHMLKAMDSEERASHLGVLPNYFARVKDRAQAVETVRQALAGDLASPQSGPAAWAALARMHAFAGDEAQALAALEKSSALNGKSDEAALAALQIGGKVSQAARPLIDKRLAAQPGTGLRMAQMRSFIDAQNYPAAYEQLERLTQEAPQYAEAWLVKASLEVQNSQVDRAERSLEVFLNLVQKQNTTDGTHKATDTPSSRGTAEALLLLATIAEGKKEFAQAHAYLDRIESPNHQARIQMRRASIEAAQGHVDQARALLREIATDNAETVRARFSAELQILRERNRHAEALEVAQQAALAMPDDPQWRYEQALSAEKLGRIADMEALLRGLIASHPRYHPPYNALGYSLADRNVSLSEARALLTKALEFAPDDAFIIDSMGWLEFRSGNLALARQLLEKAFQAQPDAEIAAHLGEVLWQLGESSAARATWQQGLKLNARNTTLLETMERFQVKP